MQVDFHRTRIRLQTPRNKQKGFQRNSQRNKAEKRGRKRSWEPADPWEGRGKARGTREVPFQLWGVSAIQSESGPSKSHSYTWDSPSETEPSPCLHLSRGGVRMGVVLGWRWDAGGGITFLYFTYFLSFRKPLQFYFTFYWPGTPSSFSAQRRKPPDYRPVGASSTLEQLCGRGWSCCYTAAAKLSPGLQVTQCVTQSLYLMWQTCFLGLTAHGLQQPE